MPFLNESYNYVETSHFPTYFFAYYLIVIPHLYYDSGGHLHLYLHIGALLSGLILF